MATGSGRAAIFHLHLNGDRKKYPILLTVMRDFVKLFCSDMFTERLVKTPANKLPFSKLTSSLKAGLPRPIYLICTDC